MLDGANENPLLDSRFPDVSSKGRGYQLHTFADGIEAWPELRKISVWQTVDALEQEFRERAAQVAQAKSTLGVDAAEAHRLISSMGAEIDEFERPDSKEGSVERDLQNRTEALTIAAGSKEELSVEATAAAAEATAKEVIEQVAPAHKQEPLERKGEEGPSRAGTHISTNALCTSLLLTLCLDCSQRQQKQLLVRVRCFRGARRVAFCP